MKKCEDSRREEQKQKKGSAFIRTQQTNARKHAVVVGMGGSGACLVTPDLSHV